MDNKKEYAVVNNMIGLPVEIMLFSTEDEAKEGMKVSIKKFFETIGASIEMPKVMSYDNFKEHMSTCVKAMNQACNNGKLSDVTFYGLNSFDIEDVTETEFIVSYSSEDEYGGYTVSDIPYLTWAVVPIA